MQENELRLSDLFVLILRKWRAIVGFAIALALVFGVAAVALRLIELNDKENQERLQAEYEAAYSLYWSEIEAVNRQIRNNESYVKQAERKLEKLAIKEENYLFSIENLEADMEYYGLQAVDMEERIEVLKEKRINKEYLLNYQNEQNANSLYMQIDPYDAKVSEIFIRVDSGYQIIPGSTYQNPDRTDELVQTYRVLVANTQFYTTLINELKLDTEVRYLSEIVSVTAYNTNSIRIRVVGSDNEWTGKVAEYISDAVLKNHDAVAQSVCDHTLDVYSNRNYSVVDMDIYNEQQALLKIATDLEDDIREIDASVLNIQSAIRQIYADVREMETKIEDINIAISNLPVEEENLNGAIDAYTSEINQLHIQRLEMLEKTEPKPAGLSLVGAIVRFVKFAIIGGIAGVLVAAVWSVLTAILRGKVLSVKQVASVLGVGFFGAWSAATEQKKRGFLGRIFVMVDRLVDRIVGAAKPDEALVCANIAATAQHSANILLCGGADEKQIASIAAQMKKRYPNLTVAAAGSVANDSNAVEGLAWCDAVVLVEQAYRSDLDAIQQTWERAQTMNKPILGVVLA